MTYRICIAIFAVVMGISAAQRALAQSNDYYVNEEARKALDGVIAAYGGAERLTNVSRMMVVMQLKFREQKMEATLYQTKDKIRRESLSGRRMIQVFDGTNAFSVVDGQRLPAPEPVREQLKEWLARGVMQASVVTKYKKTNSHVKYLGNATFENKPCFVIQTRDAENQLVEHYFDPKSHREVVEITKSKTGDQIQHFDAYQTFEGILYPQKTTTRSAHGEIIGGMELIKISADFDDSVFHPTP